MYVKCLLRKKLGILVNLVGGCLIKKCLGFIVTFKNIILCIIKKYSYIGINIYFDFFFTVLNKYYFVWLVFVISVCVIINNILVRI